MNELFPNRFIGAAVRVEAEIDRARCLSLTLNNPDDLNILEGYIAELEALRRFDLLKDRLAD